MNVVKEMQSVFRKRFAGFVENRNCLAAGFFIEWILMDGQNYVSESGYIQLPQDQLDVSLSRVR